MSIVKLVSISAFVPPSDATGEVDVFFGARRVVWCTDKNKWRIEIDNVPVDAYGQMPANGLTCYYGFKGCLDKIRKWHGRALERDRAVRFHVSYLNFEVGSLFKDMIGVDDLRGLEFVSIRRLKAELQHELFDRVATMLSKGAEGGAARLEKIRDLAHYPHLLAEAGSTPPFDEIKVFVFPFCSTQTQRVGYLALVRPGARLVGIEQNPQVDWYATVGEPWLSSMMTSTPVSKCSSS